jgi:hypothetical protein
MVDGLGEQGGGVSSTLPRDRKEPPDEPAKIRPMMPVEVGELPFHAASHPS